MNILGYLSVFLCAVLIVGGQSSTVAEDSAITKAATTASTVESLIIEAENTTGAPEADNTTDTPKVETTTPEGNVTIPQGNVTIPEGNVTIPEGNVTIPEGNVTIPEGNFTTPDGNFTTPSPSAETSTESPTTAVPSSPDLKLALNESGVVCILLNMEMTLNVEYKNATGTMVKGSYVLQTVDVVVDTEASSNCSNPKDAKEEHLAASIKGVENQLYIQFSHAEPNVNIDMLRLTLDNLQAIFEDASNETIMLQSNQSLFQYSSSKSYKCDAETRVNLLDKDGNATNSYVTFKEVKVQAFRTAADTNFAEAQDCVQDDNVSDIVPIAVGCALAALVVIVLIAYLVGRRQKRQRGYESV